MHARSHVWDSGHTILVVEDNQDTLTSIRLLLERDGHRVLTAESGEHALTLFQEHDVHLVLVDYFMPAMNGEQLIREIRSLDPVVQIILQTAYSDMKPPRQMMRQLDIQGYHDKAEGPEKLLLWVQVGLKAYRAIAGFQERERQQNELVANISHELKNPLGVIGGYAELLLQGGFGALPEKALRPVRAMAETTFSLNELVGNFLQYAKIEAKAMKVQRQWVAIRDLVRELRDVGDFLVQETDACFQLETHEAPVGLYTDGTKVRTILQNLLSNAAKFTSSGTVTLRIRAVDGAVCFIVQDTGIGISPEECEAIFQPFRQVDGSMTREHGGVGLGLALSSKLAQLMGGDLEVDSEVGVGSTFTLMLPATEATAHPVGNFVTPGMQRREAGPRPLAA